MSITQCIKKIVVCNFFLFVLLTGKAFYQAIQAANSSDQRAVLIPEGKTFSFLPYMKQITHVTNVSIFIEGTLEAYTVDFTKYWPGYGQGSYDMISFAYSDRISFISMTGDGTINGKGNAWWWYTIIVGNDERPCLLVVSQTSNLVLKGILFLNSPRFHVGFWDVLDVEVK